ncbi:unnamed protein product, partial [marine sediment metagenome]
VDWRQRTCGGTDMGGEHRDGDVHLGTRVPARGWQGRRESYKIEKTD